MSIKSLHSRKMSSFTRLLYLKVMNINHRLLMLIFQKSIIMFGTANMKEKVLEFQKTVKRLYY